MSMAANRRLPRSRSLDPNITYPSYMDRCHHGNQYVTPSQNNPFDMSGLSAGIRSPQHTPYRKEYSHDVSMLSPVSDRSVEPMSVSDISDRDLEEDPSGQRMTWGGDTESVTSNGTQWLWSIGCKTESVADDASSCVSSISRVTAATAASELTQRQPFQNNSDSDSDGSTAHSVKSIRQNVKPVQLQPIKQKQEGCLSCKRLIHFILVVVLIGVGSMMFSADVKDALCRQSLALNVSQLQVELSKHVFGQHIAISTVTEVLEVLMTSETRNLTVLSFNGWTGIGKNFISGFISKHIDEDNVHKVIIPMEFAHNRDENQHREQIFRRLTTSVTRCRLNLFVIDEVDKATRETIEGLKDALRNLTLSELANTKVIILLLSNSGGSAINRYFLDQLTAGRSRESVTRDEVVNFMLRVDEAQVSHEWYISLYIDRIITAIVPFLPLEKHHVRQCIHEYITDSRPMLGRADTNDISDRVLEQMSFFPQGRDLFSTTGCRGVTFKVDLTVD